MKESELRNHAICSLCEKPICSNGLPLFWRVRIERFGIDATAVRRQTGLAMMLGSPSLAAVMGPDEDMAIPVMEPATLTVCELCACERALPIAMLGLEVADRLASGTLGGCEGSLQSADALALAGELDRRSSEGPPELSVAGRHDLDHHGDALDVELALHARKDSASGRATKKQDPALALARSVFFMRAAGESRAAIAAALAISVARVTALSTRFANEQFASFPDHEGITDPMLCFIIRAAERASMSSIEKQRKRSNAWDKKEKARKAEWRRTASIGDKCAYIFKTFRKRRDKGFGAIGDEVDMTESQVAKIVHAECERLLPGLELGIAMKLIFVHHNVKDVDHLACKLDRLDSLALSAKEFNAVEHYIGRPITVPVRVESARPEIVPEFHHAGRSVHKARPA